MKTLNKYAVVSYSGFKIKGVLNEKETKLFHPNNKKTFLSLGDDTKILKRFTSKKLLMEH